MLDNVLIPIILGVINSGLNTAGISGTPILQAAQPTMQGVDSQPAGYIHKINDHPYGTPAYVDYYDENTSTEVHKEIQDIETMFQISTLATQSPASPTQLTASDIANLISSILRSQVGIAALAAQNIGIEKISDVRNTPFLDDRQQWQYQPSLDFTVTHKQIIVSTSPIITEIVEAIYDV